MVILAALLLHHHSVSQDASEDTSTSSTALPYRYGAPGTDSTNVKPRPNDVRGGKSEEDFEELASQSTTASQVTLINLTDSSHEGTSNERTPRPALSLAKLYIAQYVLEFGDLDERYDAMEMISTSNDEMATEFDDEYPEAIDTIADEFGLLSTSRGSYWGYSVTSTYDVAIFVARLLEEDPMNPILVAMAQTTPTAADGYAQNFGTATLEGAVGSKLGWSDDLDLHSSVSFGEGWVAAAATAGTARDLTQLVDAQLADRVAEIEEANGNGDDTDEESSPETTTAASATASASSTSSDTSATRRSAR